LLSYLVLTRGDGAMKRIKLTPKRLVLRKTDVVELANAVGGAATVTKDGCIHNHLTGAETSKAPNGSCLA
jgi:hypothetical protein